jgi:hypothetical protein
MKALHLIVASLLITGQASAQEPVGDPAKVLPPPPWLNKAASLSHWVITYAQSTESAATGESSSPENNNPESAQKTPPKTIEVTKTGKTILEKISGSTGTETQIWRKDGFILMKSSEKKDWFIGSIPPSNDPFQEADYATVDFAGFAWISAQTFAGIQLLQGSKCLVFKDKVLALSTPDVAARRDEADRAATEALLKNPNLAPTSAENTDLSKYKVDVEADIDLKTRLPVSLKVGTETRTYKYFPPPDAELELPEDAQLALNKYKKGVAAIRNISAGSP